MVQMAFCDLSHTFHKQVTNVSQHVFININFDDMSTFSKVNIDPSQYLQQGLGNMYTQLKGMGRSEAINHETHV